MSIPPRRLPQCAPITDTNADDLVVHAAITGPNDTKVERLVHYLVKVHPSSLETKSASGMTPLAVAASLGRFNLVKILIAYGADQSVKDRDWNNLIHIALATNPKASQLRNFLELLDPELRFHLLKERNSLQTSDGRTPLHQLVGRGFHGTLEDQVDQLLVLLEYSKGEELDCLDGRGDTPLHTLIRQRHPKLVREVVQLNPQLLHRENAVGQTPAELTRTMYIQACVTCPERYSSYGCEDSMATKLLHRTLEDSAEKAKGADAGENQASKGEPLLWAEQKYELANDFARRYPGKRRLVSLHEANDVARRIGETYQGQRYGWEVTED